LSAMKDRAARVKAGISLRNAARSIGVDHKTLYIYEISPDAVQTPELRERIASYYDRLRVFLGESSSDEPVATYA